MKHLGVDDEGQVRVGGAAAEPHEVGTLGKLKHKIPESQKYSKTTDNSNFFITEEISSLSPRASLSDNKNKCTLSGIVTLQSDTFKSVFSIQVHSFILPV